MEYVYAALVLHAAGKKIDEAGIKSVLKAAGVEANDARVKALVSSLDGVDIEEAIKTAVASAAPAAAAGGAAAPAAEAEKPEEKGPSEEEAMAGLGALFG
jgi:large subunit ribosomal protein L12